MRNLYLIIFLLCSGLVAVGQADTAGNYNNVPPGKDGGFHIQPLFGAGTGSMVYFGDLYRYAGSNPLLGNWGFNVSAGARLTDYLDVQLMYSSGILSYRENTPERKLNFQSEISSAGFMFAYNFNNFFRNKPKVSPVVMLGLQNFEFNSKTDLDGDYYYETDIRRLKPDGKGNYELNALSIPVGIAADIDLVHGFSLRLSSIMNFIFTDNLDGISGSGEGARHGDDKNDRYLYTGFTVLYTLDLNRNKKKKYSGLLFAGDTDDEDNDRVYDINDDCPHTPEGIVVDVKGCPLDGDGDFVPDYRDEELNSPAGSIVNSNGVILTDEDFYEMYLTYMDSLGLYTRTIKTVYTSNETGRKLVHTPRPGEETYSVQIAASTKDLTVEQIGKILSIPNVAIHNEGDTIYYLVGDFDVLEIAVEEKVLLEKDGVTGKVVAFKDNRKKEVGPIAGEFEESYKSGELEITTTPPISGAVIYRVQIGAFTHPLSLNIFEGVSDLIVLKGDDGLTRYLTGSYDNIRSAASRKIDLLLEGFEGAFIVAYRGGKRISLEEAGNITTGSTVAAEDRLDKSKISFKIQVGAYKDNIPANVMDQYISLGNVKTFRQGGITRYLVGNFPTYEAAKAKLTVLQAQGFIDAFVVGTFNNKVIPVDEAIKLLKD